MTAWVHKLKTVPRLGICNVARVALYRLSFKYPFSPIRTLIRTAKSRDNSLSHPIFRTDLTADISDFPQITLPNAFGIHATGKAARPPNWFKKPTQWKCVREDRPALFHAQ